MDFRHAASQREFTRMTTEELRAHFLVQDLFAPGQLQSTYWETDRTVLGSAVPLAEPLALPTFASLAAEFFCQRRELGVINLGGPGSVEVDGTSFDMAHLTVLYIGMGNQRVTFSSAAPSAPALYYLVSYPSAFSHPSVVIPIASANRVELGSTATANKRTLYQYIHQGGARSSQLVMGFTRLEEGSVWNTMPPHTHSRRSEVYCYFGLPAEAAVVHLMGPGDETRHLFIHCHQAVLSPIWSIHSGCGTQAYSFVWAMGGENQHFTDMDPIAISELK